MVWSVTVIWGISFIATRVVVNSIPPLTAALIRFMIASLTLVILSRGKIKDFLSKDVIFAGFWGVTAYFVFENSGLVFTYPTNASLIISSAPILYTIFSHLIQKRKTTMKEYLASFLAFTGVAIIILNGRFILKLNPFGDFLMLGAALSWVFYTYHIDRIKDGDSLSIIVSITIWGSIFLIPFSIFEKKNDLSLDFKTLISLLYLSIVCSGIAYFFWNTGIKRINPRYTTNTIYFIPLVTSVADSIILKNFPNFYTVLGGLTVLSGLWILNNSRK